MQVGNPFLEKLLMEACLELARMDAVVAMQDLGAAGLTCALAELSARGDCGAEIDLDLVPTREPEMRAYELLLSESQERMLIVVRAGREHDVRAVFERYELHAATIGRVIGEPVVRATLRGAIVCEVPGPSAGGRGAAVHVHPPLRLQDLEARPQRESARPARARSRSAESCCSSCWAAPMCAAANRSGGDTTT